MNPAFTQTHVLGMVLQGVDQSVIYGPPCIDCIIHTTKSEKSVYLFGLTSIGSYIPTFPSDYTTIGFGRNITQSANLLLTCHHGTKTVKDEFIQFLYVFPYIYNRKDLSGPRVFPVTLIQVSVYITDCFR